MNFLRGGEHHRSHVNPATSAAANTGPHFSAPGDAFLLATRPGDVRGFIHRSFIGRAVGGVVSSVVGSVPIVGGLASGIFDRIRGEGGGAAAVPQVTQCPPGFFLSGSGCVPTAGPTFTQQPVTSGLRRAIGARGRPAPFAGARTSGAFVQPTPVQQQFRESLDLAADPAAGVPVMGRFGAGFEPTVFMSDTRRCGRGAVLGVDGICYNKRDLRNNERFWPRGRRPLLTGGEMRAISTASSAAKKLQRKQKQLEGLGLLKRPAPRARRALPPGHTASLTHG